MKNILIWICLCGTCSIAQSQNWCGFSDELTILQQDSLRFACQDQYFTSGLSAFRAKEGAVHISNPSPPCPNCFTSSGCPKATYVLPVVVHIVHLPGHSSVGTGSNITDAQIENAIEKLNMAFRNASLSPYPSVNTGIQFCLAKIDYAGSPFSGIVRQSSNLSDFKDNQRNSLFTLGQYYSADKYINIYVVNQLLDSSGTFVGKLGTSTFPWSTSGNGLEGIVVAHDFFGNYGDMGSPLDTNSLGLVLPHEMGHYLGLYHPFDFECTGTTDATCATQGDKCCDVPAVKGKHQDCNTPQNTCVGENYNGSDPYDQKENYMDYTRESCKNTFTPDQTSIMHYVLQAYRSNLWRAENVNYLQLSCCVLSAQFSGEDFMCNGSNDSNLLTAFHYTNSVTYKWRFTQNNILKYSFNRSTNTLYAKGMAPGVYSVSLTIDDGTDTIVFTRKNWFTVGDCSQKRPSTNSNWFFGNYAGVRFYNGGTFRDYSYHIANQSISQPNPGEGTISVSNSQGRLLFYGGTNYNNPYPTRADFRMYDSLYAPMQGEPLKSWDNATTPAIAFPMADSSKLYWVVTNTQDTLYQNIVNLNITSTTKGAITQKDKVITLPSWLASTSTDFMEGLAAVQHCNGKDHWVIAQVLKGTTSYLAVFNAKKTGIVYDSAYVVNQIGNQTNMKVSPDGRWIAIEQQIFLFDRKTGRIKSYTSPNDGSRVLSVVFSPDSKKLYRYEQHFTTPVYFGIRQYDLGSGATDLGRISIAENYDVMTLQTGPDSIIYVNTVDFPDYLFAITKPDSINNGGNNACGFTRNFVRLNSNGIGGTANIGLPQITNALPADSIKPNFTYSITNCRNVRFIMNQCCLNSQVNWKFGDGSTGTGLDTLRNYTAGGKYKVVMKWTPVDSAVHWVNLRNDSADFKIFGDTVVCDSSIFNTYQTAIFKSKINYTWSFSGASSNSQFNNIAETKWSSNGYVKLKITDSKTGCKDSGFLNVRITSSLANNVIDSNQNVCDTGQLQLMHGSSPTGGGGAYSYQWYYRPTDSMKWRTVPGGTGQNTSPIRRDTSFQYYRLVSSNGCQISSNVIQANSLYDFRTLEKGGVCLGKIYVRNRPLAGIAGYSIQWQKSTDSLNWTNVSGATGDTLTVNSTVLRVWYRQRVIHGACTIYSPPIEKGDMYITLHPAGAVGCGSIPFVLRTKVKSTTGSLPHYLWQYQNSTNNWVNLGGHNDDSLMQWVTWTGYRNYRCQFTSFCGSSYSNNASIGSWANPSVISMDSNKTVSSGTPIRLKGQWAGERNVCYAVWQRSKNPTGATWDSIGMTLEDSFTVIPNYTECQQRMYYRIALRNLCPAAGKNYWNNAVKSKFIEVGGYQHTSPQPDVWIPDSRRDRFITQGAEPNWKDSNNYTGSYYLWNRKPDNYGNPVNDWLDRENVNADLDTNWIHTIVYNRGTDSNNINGTVYFYWTLMSTNEDWPFSWTGNAKFVNRDPNSGWYLDTFPMGGRINKTGVQISDFLTQAPYWPGHPPYNGKLGIGDSVLVSYPWIQTDTIPQPWWYHGTVNNAIKYANQLGLCLLARIQECDSPNYALSYPEKLNYGNSNVPYDSNYTANIGYNIVNNNNITSANFYLGYMNPPFSDTVQTWVFGAPIPSDDTTGEREMEFDFCVQDPQYYQNADVLITMCDEMWDIFNAANKPGVGFYSPAANQIVVTDPCAEIGPITVPDTFSTLLGFNFRYLPGANQSGTPISSVFTLRETVDQSIETGSTTFGVHSFLNGNGQNHGGGQGGEPAQLQIAKIDSIKNSLMVFPNPFSNDLKIEYVGVPNGKVQIELFDLKGSLIQVICNCVADAQGKTEIMANLPKLAAGTYTIKVIENGKTKTEMVIRRN